MSRTAKDIVEYFPHDAGARDSDTLLVLQNRFGNNGYAFWFKLLERLCQADGHFLDLTSPLKWQVFVAKMAVPEITATEMLFLLSGMQAIDNDLWVLRLIWCQHLVDNLAEVYRKRGRPLPQKPFSATSNPFPATKNPFPVAEMLHSRVEYKIGNKNKVDTDLIILWAKTLELLQTQVNKSNYNSWLAGTKPIKLAGDALTVATKTQHQADYLLKNQRSLIEKALCDVTGKPAQRVEFVIGEER